MRDAWYLGWVFVDDLILNKKLFLINKFSFCFPSALVALSPHYHTFAQARHALRPLQECLLALPLVFTAHQSLICPIEFDAATSQTFQHLLFKDRRLGLFHLPPSSLAVTLRHKQGWLV